MCHYVVVWNALDKGSDLISSLSSAGMLDRSPCQVHLKPFHNDTHMPCSLQSPHFKGKRMITSIWKMPLNRSIHDTRIFTPLIIVFKEFGTTIIQFDLTMFCLSVLLYFLPVAVGALLHSPELLRPRPNRQIGRRVEPLAGERRPPRPSQAPSRPGSRRSGPDAGNPEMLEFALSQETARTAPLLPPVEVREENLLFHFFFSSAAGPRASRRRWQSGTPLSCARRLLSSWQRMQSSRSLQPR